MSKKQRKKAKIDKQRRLFENVGPVRARPELPSLSEGRISDILVPPSLQGPPKSSKPKKTTKKKKPKKPKKNILERGFERLKSIFGR